MKHKKIYVNCLAFQLSLAKKQVVAWYQRSLKPMGLTPTYVYVLGILNDHGPTSPTEIALALELEKPTVTSLLNRMVRDGFVVRKENPQSRRAIVVSLTPKGKQICKQAYEVLQRADQTLNKKLKGNLSQVKEQIQFLNQTAIAEESI